MATQETQIHKTPNGGVKSTAFFKDAFGRPTDKSKAVAMEIIEYDKDGNEIARTYMEK